MPPLIVRSLGSGSSGNALLVEAGETAVLVDCGVDGRALTAGLSLAGRDLNHLDALLVTHEHIDHVRLLSRLISHGLPIIATAGSARALAFPKHRWERIRCGRPLRFKNLTITGLAVSHDAAEPCGYFIEAAAASLVVLTDLGLPDPALIEVVAAADLIVLEANHDEEMLAHGPYPLHLKRRIAGALGHLSNDACGQLLVGALGAGGPVRTIWLAHLSRTNNQPDLARMTVERAFAARGIAHEVTPLPRTGRARIWRSGESAGSAIQMNLPLF